MKKILFVLGLACMGAYSCTMDLNPTNSTRAEVLTSQEDWQKVLHAGKDSIIAQHIRSYTRKNIIKDGSYPYNYEIDVNRPDLIKAYGIPVYTIDSTLWATQPDLPFEEYLKLDMNNACFYLAWGGHIINRVAAAYQNEMWKSGQIFSGMSDSEGSLAAQAIENEDRIISVNVRPKSGGGFLVYVFKNGKWVRIDNGLRYDPDDVVKDLRKGFNRSILR